MRLAAVVHGIVRPRSFENGRVESSAHHEGLRLDYTVWQQRTKSRTSLDRSRLDLGFEKSTIGNMSLSCDLSSMESLLRNILDTWNPQLRLRFH